MIPDWAESHLGEVEPAEQDPVAGKPISWGRPVIIEFQEEQFADLRGRCEVVCVYPTWYIITKRIQFADLLMEHGPVRAIGVGPGGGFKWVRLEDKSVWGHASFANRAKMELTMSARLAVKCDADGKEAGAAPRIPRRVIGRPFAVARHVRKRGR